MPRRGRRTLVGKKCQIKAPKKKCSSRESGMKLTDVDLIGESGESFVPETQAEQHRRPDAGQHLHPPRLESTPHRTGRERTMENTI